MPLWWINSLVPARFQWKFCTNNFRAYFSDWWQRYRFWNCPQMNITGPFWWWVNIGSGIGLVPSGNQPLPESMLTKIFVTMQRQNSLTPNSLQAIMCFFYVHLLCDTLTINIWTISVVIEHDELIWLDDACLGPMYETVWMHAPK